MTSSELRIRKSAVRRAGLLLCVIAFCLVSGCSNQPPTYPVQGEVRFETGARVIVGMVELKSLEHGINARGEIQRDGTFQLTTFDENDGAVAGEHKCVVLQRVMREHVQGHRPSKLGVVHPRYGVYTTSGLTVTIEPGEVNRVKLEVRGLMEQPEEGTPHKH